MKLKFELEVEIATAFAQIMSDDPEYWASLLQERINVWRQTSRDDSAFKDFIVRSIKKSDKEIPDG